MNFSSWNNPFFPIPPLAGPGNMFLSCVTGLPISFFAGKCFTNYVSPTAYVGA